MYDENEQTRGINSEYTKTEENAKLIEINFVYI